MPMVHDPADRALVAHRRGFDTVAFCQRHEQGRNRSFAGKQDVGDLVPRFEEHVAPLKPDRFDMARQPLSIRGQDGAEQQVALEGIFCAQGFGTAHGHKLSPDDRPCPSDC